MAPCSYHIIIAHNEVIVFVAGWSLNSKGAAKVSPLCPRKDACGLGRLLHQLRFSS
jgi:hypothetical protein